MPSDIRCTIRRLGILFAASIFALVTPGPQAYAELIVLGDVDYTREGRADDGGRNAVETYLEFFLSRLRGAAPKRIAQYVRECTSGVQLKEPDGSCSFPDYYIQLLVAERQGEVQISGAVGQKTETRNMRAHNLESIRVKISDITEGLSRVTKNIGTILASTAASVEPTRVIIACFGSAVEESDVPPGHGRLSTGRRPTAKSALSIFAERLPNVLQELLQDPPRMRVSINMGARAECSSLDGLQAIAQTGRAEAVLSGSVFTDDKSGLLVLPYIWITGASKKVALPTIWVPRGGDKASFVREGGTTVQTVASAKLKDIDASWYLLVARKLGAATSALVRSSKRAEFVEAVDNGSEISFYLARAKEHLSSSPPNYALADALLELAQSKAPGEQQSYIMLASSLTDRTRYEEAASTLRLGLKEVSERKALYLALAENFVRAESLPAARAVYEEALSAKILADEALLGIARTYLATGPDDGSLKEAMRYALQAAKQNPSSSEGYLLAGQIAQAAKNFEQAERYYNEALKIAPASGEIRSRLSNLYERWVIKIQEEGAADLVENSILYLTKSIEASPSVRKYFDRAVLYLVLAKKHDDRTKSYALASADYQAALSIARRDRSELKQFPWLMPNLVETLILEGKFQPAKKIAQELFVTLGGNAAVRPSTDPKEIRLIAAFLNATAEILDTGSADRELYLLENAILGLESNRLGWSFDDMLSYFDTAYPRIKSELSPAEQAARVAAVKQWIIRLSARSR